MGRRLLLLIAVLLAALVSPALATTYPPGFEERTIAANLTGPVGVAWTPDGRMIVIEKYGRIKIFPVGSTTPATTVDISKRVSSYWDRGLHGIAVDSNFTSNHYVYLLYTAELNPLQPDSSTPAVSRLARYQLTDTNQLTGETIILGTWSAGACPSTPSNTVDCIPADSPSHMIGTVRSAPDGTLYVGSGDGSSFGAIDLRAFRAYNEQSMAGKIMHVDRDGHGLPGHSFCPTNIDFTQVCTKLFAKGFRNPFRFTLRPDGRLTIGDVGWNTREEIDLAEPGGHSYGWPCYEGSMHTPGYDALSQCAPEYAKEGTPSTHTPPSYDYLHTGSNAVIGGPTYQGAGYPSTFKGRTFFGDYAAGWVKSFATAPDGSLTDVQVFADGWYGTDLETTPDGNLAYVQFGDGTAGTGAVKQVVYTSGNSSPTAHAAANPASGPPPLQVTFSSAGTSDPDGDPLTYAWDFGDGGTSTDANPKYTYNAAGVYQATLTVSDDHGHTGTDTVQVVVGGHPPVATITAPADESLYRDGNTITFRGSATDAEDGTLPASRLSWNVIIHHSTHIHQVGTFDGVSQGSFTTLRDHDADSYYEIALTATDSDGLTDVERVQIRPETVPLQVTSNPTGAAISYGGVDATAPFSTNAAIGFRTTISAANLLTAGDGRRYVFDSWSDGGARAHQIEVPDKAATFTATYLEDKAFGRSATASSSQAGHDPGHAVDGDATTRWSTSPADGQWWQVDLGAARQVSGVQIDWDTAYASSYQILTSVDGVNFTPVAQTGAPGPGLQTDRFTERTARYVRVAAMQAATLAGVSFWEARVFGPADGTPSYAATVAATPGLVNWWRLDDNGTTAADSAGTGTGTYAGGAASFTSLLSQDAGSSHAFDGVNDFVDLSPAAFGTPAQFSVEAWVRLDRRKTEPSGLHFLVADAFDQSTDGFALFADNLNLPRFSVVQSANVGMTVVAPFTLQTGGTYHVVGTYDGANVRLYVNGVERVRSAYTGGISYNASRELYLASQTKSFNRSVRFLAGKLDEVALYNQALPAAAVQQHYLRGR